MEFNISRTKWKYGWSINLYIQCLLKLIHTLYSTYITIANYIKQTDSPSCRCCRWQKINSSRLYVISHMCFSNINTTLVEHFYFPSQWPYYVIFTALRSMVFIIHSTVACKIACAMSKKWITICNVMPHIVTS